MKINKDSLKARANNIANKYNISQNIIYSRFFYDAFLKRLSISKYYDKFILKGGLYLSSIFGIDSRSTMDIDFCLTKLPLNKENIINIINEIINGNYKDGIDFNIVRIDEIRNEDVYGGFQITLLGKLENVKCQFGIDIATGDPIIPSEKEYNYNCLVSEEELTIKTYSLESVIAEKLETILSRGIFNSRSKDYYDLYVLWKTKQEELSKKDLLVAYFKTCEYRKFTISKEDALNLLDEIGNNSQINKRWNSYCKITKYAEGLLFKDVIETIKEIIEFLIK